MAASTMRLLLCVSGAALASAAVPGFPCLTAPIVLESKTAPPEGQDAWPAACLGLSQQGDLKSTSADCKAACVNHQSCSVWQLSKDDYCYISDSYDQASDCWGRDASPEASTVAKAGERLQHGSINVTQTLPNNAYYPGLKHVGTMNTQTDSPRPVRCKNQCYSDINCGVWFYVEGAATDPALAKGLGCWLQNKDSQLGNIEQLPAGQTSTGETVTHYCDFSQQDLHDAAKAVGILASLGAGLLLAACCTLCLCCGLFWLLIYCLCCHGKKEKTKTTRAVKVAPKKEPKEVLQPLVPMPVVQQPMVAYAAPTFTTAVMTPTYQAVPQAAPATYASVPMVQSVAAAPAVQMQVSSVAAVPRMA
jgi:hypothetical protein